MHRRIPAIRNLEIWQFGIRNYASPHLRYSESGIMHFRMLQLRIRNYASPHFRHSESGIIHYRMSAIRNPEVCTTAFPQFGLRNHASPHRSTSAIPNIKGASMKFLNYTTTNTMMRPKCVCPLARNCKWCTCIYKHCVRLFWIFKRNQTHIENHVVQIFLNNNDWFAMGSEPSTWSLPGESQRNQAFCKIDVNFVSKQCKTTNWTKKHTHADTRKNCEVFLLFFVRF